MTVNVLVSYGVAPNHDLSELRRGLGCGRIMVDSGAFSAHASGKTITLDGYAKHLDRWAGWWDHAITLDIIGDPVGTARNTRRLHERGYPVMPVFTLGGKLAEFDAIVRDGGYVAVGGLVGLPRPTIRARGAMLQRRAADNGGGIHLLGVGSMSTLRAARPYSADTSSVGSMFRFGNLLYFDGAELRQVNLQHRAKLAAARDHLAAQGVSLAALLRARRMPTDSAARLELHVALTWAYACGDEVLHRAAVTMARSPHHPPGTHLYIAVSGGDSAAAALRVARSCHGLAPAPRAWHRWGARHTCHRGTAAADTGETA